MRKPSSDSNHASDSNHIDITKDIDSLTRFKRHTPAYLERLQETNLPLILTVNGKAALVVQSAEAWQEMVDMVEQAKFVLQNQ